MQLKRLGAMLVLVILSGCAEILDAVIEVAEVSHCSGCDWIVQEWHDDWETHNSDPYDDETTCEKALTEQSRRDPDFGFRCIHEEELIDARREKSASQWETDRVKLDYCWRCDWRIENWEYGIWAHRDTNTFKTQGLCEQTLWYRSKRNRDERYRCVY